MIHTEEFTHDGKEFEVRVISDGISVLVQVFSDGKPANAIVYKATVEAVDDAAAVLGLDAVKRLINIAKADITT